MANAMTNSMRRTRKTAVKTIRNPCLFVKSSMGGKPNGRKKNIIAPNANAGSSDGSIASMSFDFPAVNTRLLMTRPNAIPVKEHFMNRDRRSR